MRRLLTWQLLALATFCLAPAAGAANEGLALAMARDGSFSPVPDDAPSAEVAVGPGAARKFAVVVGINEYDNTRQGIPHLRYAVADAHGLHDALVDPARGGSRRKT